MKYSFLDTLFLNKKELEKVFDKPFRNKQIIDFIFSKKQFDFKNMHNIPKAISKTLNTKYNILDIKEIKKETSKDKSEKYLFELHDKNCVESVKLTDKNKRSTFCISTQVGCRMSCSYCQTGKMGLLRNLSFTEILSQILFLSKNDESYNIVFMGMGEPLDNFDNLVKSIEILINKNYFGLSKSRITISTCGIINKIKEFSEVFPNINLAVSINSLIQKKRESIMPIAKKNNIKDLISSLIDIYEQNKNRITLEYVLIDNFNDGNDEINEFKNIPNQPFLINIIPDNNNKKNENSIKIFSEKLIENGFNVTRRYRRGEDINAACGQLYWSIKKHIKE